MPLENPIYISNNLTEAEAPPRDSFIDSFNANNLISAGEGNLIKNSRRCTMIHAKHSVLNNKYNTHIIGERASSSWKYIFVTTYTNVFNQIQYYVKYIGSSSLQSSRLNTINNTFEDEYDIQNNVISSDVFYPLYFDGGYLIRINTYPLLVMNRINITTPSVFDWGAYSVNGVGYYLLIKDGEVFYDTNYEDVYGLTYELNKICKAKLIEKNSQIFISSESNEADTEVRLLSNALRSDSKSDSNRFYIMCSNGLKIQSPLNKNSLSVGKSRDINGYYDVIANNASDIRLKDNVLKISGASKKINNLSAVSFVWNDRQASHSGDDIGLIAQQVEKQFPEITTTRDNGVKAINYKKMTAILVACIKEKQQRINNIKEKINKLKNGTK